jgi:benzoyl-CoA reductase/2-hydroxyglutaryl-CoA dehydratase subunit BcrC/BadD/HgdB
METLTVAEIIERATAATSSLFDSSGLKLIKDFKADLPEIVGDQDKRLHSVWEYYQKLPYMDVLYAPRKRDEEAVQLYLADLEDFRDRLSLYGMRRIPQRDLADAIRVYNRGREIMSRLYELRKRDRPPVTGAEALEVSKAAARLPRERFNELMEQLLDEIQRSGTGNQEVPALMSSATTFTTPARSRARARGRGRGR